MKMIARFFGKGIRPSLFRIIENAKIVKTG